MTVCAVYIERVGGPTLEIRGYNKIPNTLPDRGDFIRVPGKANPYRVVERMWTYSDQPEALDCFVTLYVTERKPSLLRRLWRRLRGRDGSQRIQQDTPQVRLPAEIEQG